LVEQPLFTARRIGVVKQGTSIRKPILYVACASAFRPLTINPHPIPFVSSGATAGLGCERKTYNLHAQEKMPKPLIFQENI
jgi:hypothetical protein